MSASARLLYERVRCYLIGHCPCDLCVRGRVCRICGTTARRSRGSRAPLAIRLAVIGALAGWLLAKAGR